MNAFRKRVLQLFPYAILPTCDTLRGALLTICSQRTAQFEKGLSAVARNIFL
jgi:hypothetical protein